MTGIHSTTNVSLSGMMKETKATMRSPVRRATLKDAVCRMRGAEVEHTVGLDELDARAGAWIECAMRAEATICRSR